MDRPERTRSLRRPPLTALWGERWIPALAGDVVLLGLLLGAVSLIFTGIGTRRGEPSAAEISVGGRTVLSLPPHEEGIRPVEGTLGTTRIEFRGGRARVLSSPCPFKLCQRAGWIGAAGEMLACVPNEVVVRFSGRPDKSVDAVSR